MRSKAHSLCKTPKTRFFSKHIPSTSVILHLCWALYTHISIQLTGGSSGGLQELSWGEGSRSLTQLGCYSAAAVWPGLCISKHRRHASPSLKFWPRFNQATAQAAHKFTCNSLFQPKSSHKRTKMQLGAPRISNFHPAIVCHVNAEK